MTYPRELIYSSLFALLSSQSCMSGFRYMSRRGIIFSTLSPDQSPAMMMEQIGENQTSSGRGMPYRWELDVMVALVVDVNDPSVIPASIINPVADAIEAILPGAPKPVQTLAAYNNGIPMVSSVILFGNGKGNSGTMGSKAFTMIPIRIITP